MMDVAETASVMVLRQSDVVGTLSDGGAVKGTERAGVGGKQGPRGALVGFFVPGSPGEATDVGAKVSLALT